jgi:RNA polymerase sigma-70 factor (ECF subfamily)
MLGSASDAEDVLQDAWVRLSGADTSDVRSPQAFSATVVTRLCLDRLKSARAQREQYIGPWLPEPVLTTVEGAPDLMAERSESITLAFLVLLETLSAEERAVFLLKEMFDYEHAEIAAMLGTTAANSRQLLSRARSKVRRTPSPAFAVTPERTSRHDVAARFARAFQSGDASQLTQLLAAEVSFVADGGGKAVAARKPIAGRDRVLQFLIGIKRSARATGVAARAAMQVTEVNSEPALVLQIDNQLDGVFVLTIDAGEITAIRVVRNPEKLAYLNRQLALSPPTTPS